MIRLKRAMCSALKNARSICCSALLAAAALASCTTFKKLTDTKDDGSAMRASSHATTLLGMTYSEAAALSPKKLDVAPNFRVAADEIEVVRTNKDGSPRTVRAKGKVFLDMVFGEQPGTALCQEAYFGDEEVILRGHPLMKRGSSVVEGLADSTVFYMFGPRLRVIGRHRLTNEGQLMAAMASAPGPQREFNQESLKLATWGRPWEGGPNPLLPPLSPSSVPDKVRNDLQKAAEAEAVLQRARMEPVMPLREDAPAPEKPAPLDVPPLPDAAAKKEGAKEDKKTGQPRTKTDDADKKPDAPASGEKMSGEQKSEAGNPAEGAPKS